MVNIDAAVKYLGDFGIYQKYVYFVLQGPAIWVGMHNLIYVFLGATPKHRCFIPGLDNETYPQYSGINFSEAIPWDGKANEYDSCKRYDINYTAPGWDAQPVGVIKCDRGWVYDDSQYSSTVVSEFDLVCDAEYKNALTASIYMAGVLVGAIIFGDLSDRIGRLTVHSLSLLLLLLFGTASAFMPEYISFTISRFLVGCVTSGVYLVLFVLALEMIGDTVRTPCGIAVQGFFAVGFMLDGLLAYLIRDWMWLQLAITIPGAGFLCYFWILPESVRWLLAEKRFEEAENVVRKAAHVNKVYLPEHVFAREISKGNVPSQRHTVVDLLRTPNMRKKSLIMFFEWFVASLVYYGLSLNTAALVGDEYVNFVLSGAVEIPGYILCVFTMNYLGRRLSLALTMILAGVACVGAGFIQNENIAWMTTALALTGKMFIAASFAVVYNYAAELFPTVARNTGIGISSMAARVGGIIAPQIALLDNIASYMSVLVMGSMGLVAGSLGFLLPETKGKPLPDTMVQGEAFGKKGATLPKAESDFFTGQLRDGYVNPAVIGDSTAYIGESATPEQYW